jgi:hypothetical protein
MIGKIPVLGFALVTAMSGTALAHEPHASHDRQGGYGSYRGGYAAPAAVDLRRADLNRNGFVTMQEALASGRRLFRRQDRDDNWALTRRELRRPWLRHGDRNDDGRVSMREYQRAVRQQFARLDANRDGYLSRRELGGGRPRATRSASWRR